MSLDPTRGPAGVDDRPLALRLWSSTPIHGARLADAERINGPLAAAFRSLSDADFTRRTHYFGGRYENLYLERHRIPEVAAVLATAERFARAILGWDRGLRCGFWLNAQGPGQSTTPHNHDENDELLSGVYYVQVPPDSGDLVLLDGWFRVHVTPAAGLMLFFPPQLMHQVETNRSGELRLSLAFNFGPADD